MKSVMSIVRKVKNTDNQDGFNLKFKQNDISISDELGRHIQKLIDNAKRGDEIELPGETIRAHSLYINKPITLIGKAGTVIEIEGGCISIDFRAKGD